jgi:lipopolysaccharide transport system ATP-binding protein
MSTQARNDRTAIEVRNLEKTYVLNQSNQVTLRALFGLEKRLFSHSDKNRHTVFAGLSFNIKQGERVGIVGRNGCGKTTLLRIIAGSVSPTTGHVTTTGQVQTLLTTGVGFVPDLTGRENIQGALQRAQINRADRHKSETEIIDFAEIGTFIDQPFKTYSAGMQSRLMFAVATSLTPEILLIDEILGAGDAYFVAKCSRRMQRLVSNGATLLLVSHSSGQILEFCTRCIWLDNGSIRMDGNPLEVIKAYEESVLIRQELSESANIRPTTNQPLSPPKSESEESVLIRQELSESANIRPTTNQPLSPPKSDLIEGVFQDFRPSELSESKVSKIDTFRSLKVSRGGISRWERPTELKIENIEVQTDGRDNVLYSGSSVVIRIQCHALKDFEGRLRLGLALEDLKGDILVKIYSPELDCTVDAAEDFSFRAVLDKLRVGPGNYLLGASLHGEGPLHSINSSKRFDLLSRSFEVDVNIENEFSLGVAKFVQDADWGIF